MKKIIFTLLLFGIFGGVSSGRADQQTIDNDATDRAKEDYRVFLKELKVLNGQYKQISSEIQKIVKEEGAPAWEGGTDELEPGPAQLPVFGDADIRETDKEMIVKVDLPGVEKNEIKVSLENSKTLRIEGERNEEKEEKGKSGEYRYNRVERQHGKFERLVLLPSIAKEKGTEASYENGVLTVIIPKAEQPKEIAIPVR